MPAKAVRDGHGSRRGAPGGEALRVLESLRRILRAIDLDSKRLASEHGVTTPQVLCLRALYRPGGLTPTGLARRVHLSPSTVIGILDRLEGRGLVRREREEDDRRRVRVTLTRRGRTLVRRSPTLLQDRLARGLRALPAGERTAVARALETVVRLMEAGRVEAAPILATGPLGGGRRGAKGPGDPRGGEEEA